MPFSVQVGCCSTGWKMMLSAQWTEKNPQLLDLWKTSTTVLLCNPNLRLTLNSSSITLIIQDTRQSKLSSSSWVNLQLSMQEHADYVAETLSYLQLMGGSCWRTSVTCSEGDSWVCNSVKTKHKISMSPVKQRWVACLVGGNGDSPGDGKHLTCSLMKHLPCCPSSVSSGAISPSTAGLFLALHIPSAPAVH